MRLDHPAQLVEIDIHAGGLGVRGVNARRGLLHTEAVGAVTCEIEPSQGRDVEPSFRTAMAAVPEAIEAIGVLATFGHQAGIDDQALLMFRGGTTSVMAVLWNDTQSKEVAYHREKVLS